MSSWSSLTDGNVVLGFLDASKCRPRAAGQVETLTWSSWTSRNVVMEQLDGSKQLDRSSRTGVEDTRVTKPVERAAAM